MLICDPTCDVAKKHREDKARKMEKDSDEHHFKEGWCKAFNAKYIAE
jgi:hypothetical protein